MKTKETSAESLLIITGTMGSGKTAVLAESSDLLARRRIAHAAIDLDAIGLAHLPSAANSDDVMYRNLQCVWQNYASLGVRRLFLAHTQVEPATEYNPMEAVSAGGSHVALRRHDRARGIAGRRAASASRKTARHDSANAARPARRTVAKS